MMISLCLLVKCAKFEYFDLKLETVKQDGGSKSENILRQKSYVRALINELAARVLNTVFIFFVRD